MKKTFMMPVVCSLLAASMMLSGCSAVSNGDNAVGGDIEANGDQEHWPDGAGYVQSVLLCHG